jgi:hypothetical protein
MKKIKGILFLSFLLFSLLNGTAQKTYEFDASNAFENPQSGYFKMGNPGPEKSKIIINNQYLTIGDKPVLPVMGEFHFSRVKPAQWEDCILKMKACGINIISSYLFWNRHEEIEGAFDWEGEKDVRAFVQLCQKHNLFVYMRIGPWAHGEARNGGTPDWILRKKEIKDRSNDVVYQNYVTRYFAQIAQQLEGLYYKDGGNIIGIQLENEYWHAKEGEPHIKWLKETAMSLGMDVPIYTVTGWGNGSVPPFEVIPLWGAYPDAPWAEHLNKELQPGNFMFESFRDNKNIGNDQKNLKDKYMSYDQYPYFTCEMGVGIQNTYHRRLVIDPIDGLGMITAKIGSGSNLLGYYMFAGGTQFHGLLHAPNEEQEETGYYTRVPVKSYDFQAAIKESGEISAAYKQVKKLHYFVNEFGRKLAPMGTVIGTSQKEGLQIAVRSDNQSGFLFGINYVRYQPKPVCLNSRFSVRFQKETIEFPINGVNIPDSAIFIWPLNFEIGKARLKYATAQLIGIAGQCHLFFQNKNIPVEMAFDQKNIDKVVLSAEAKGTIQTKGDQFVVTGLHPGKKCLLTLNLKSGEKERIIVLTQKEADNCWIFSLLGKKECFISESNMMADNENVYLYDTKNQMNFSYLKASNEGKFIDSVTSVPVHRTALTIKPHAILSDAKWLESGNFKNIPTNQQRYHRFFFKEFSLENPSNFRKATLYIYPEADGKLNLNNVWIRQAIVAKQLNVIDLTGYINKGENGFFIDFPFLEGVNRFAARIIVEYANYDKIEIVTDQSWLTADMYTNPSPLKTPDKLVPPVIVKSPDYAKGINLDAFKEWDVTVPYNTFDGLNNVYLNIKYKGDRAEIYNDHQLSADNFNDNVNWNIGLLRQEHNVNGKTLRMVIYELTPETKIFFDVLPKADGFNQCEIEKFEVNPEYKIRLN